MTAALVAHTKLTPTGTSGGTTPAINTLAAINNGLIILSVATGAVSTINVSDSKGNTWTPLINTGGSVVESAIYYCENPTVDANHTFTCNHAGALENMCVAAFGGLLTGTITDQSTGAHVTSTTIQAGSITPSQNHNLIIATLANDLVGSVVSIDSGFTITDYSQLVPSDAYGCGLAYLVQNAAAAVNPKWTVGSSVDLAAAIANFKGTPPAGFSFGQAIG
jgi:hypothetical protein